MKIGRWLAVLTALAGAVSPVLSSQAAPGQETAGGSPKADGPQQLVILDTDIGDDIDDAFALALVLRSPELRLVGITTEYGNTELRARLVDRFLAAVGRQDIPVATGIDTPQQNIFTQAAYANQRPTLLGTPCAMPVSQTPTPRRKKDLYQACQNNPRDAIQFILSTVKEHPGEITLIAIGPLFNIQAAIERDSATFRKLKRVVMMGGSIHMGYRDRQSGSTETPPSPEWNIRCDPAGARALLASGVPVFLMPLDSTQISLPQPEQARLFSHGSPLTDQLTLLYHQWSGPGEWRTPTLFDPVAVTYAIRPDLCPAQPMRLEVDDKGFTRPVPGQSNAQVCLHSDENGFLNFLINRIAGEPRTAAEP